MVSPSFFKSRECCVQLGWGPARAGVPGWGGGGGQPFSMSICWLQKGLQTLRNPDGLLGSPRHRGQPRVTQWGSPHANAPQGNQRPVEAAPRWGCVNCFSIFKTDAGCLLAASCRARGEGPHACA